LYHQIGKALVPPEYQVSKSSFSAEEIAVYRKYTIDGRLLVAKLQEGVVKAKDKRAGTVTEIPTKNIPWLMIRESCEQHMERFDGSGYPAHRQGKAISPIAQVVGFAKELDRLAAETMSEKPFDEAVEAMRSGAGSLWDPDLVKVFNGCVDQCRAVYEKFIYYPQTLPETIPLVVKREGRPMGLSYRPMLSNEEGLIVGYEAIPWFAGIANRPGETEPLSEVDEMLKRTDSLTNVTFYMLYEAADLLLRMQNCKIETEGVLVHVSGLFYKTDSLLQKFQRLFEDQPIDKSKLMLTIPEEVVLNAGKTLEELLSRYSRNGVTMVVDGYHPDNLPVEKLILLGIRTVRMAPELNLKKETSDAVAKLKASSIRVLGCEASELSTVQWMASCGMELISGPMTGHLRDEDAIIRDSLAAARE
ncbi:MAG: EAL domain-containing protein, partial [Clostridia bacterium]|nr:EAL domain-containing protein [Clostridia bacterium]